MDAWSDQLGPRNDLLGVLNSQLGVLNSQLGVLNSQLVARRDFISPSGQVRGRCEGAAGSSELSHVHCVARISWPGRPRPAGWPGHPRLKDSHRAGALGAPFRRVGASATVTESGASEDGHERHGGFFVRVGFVIHGWAAV